MKQMITGPAMPTAQICINKSRLKVYNKEKDPTYYLNKGQEFQIELFNPTSETILAKIYLNGKAISQGGLVLRPAERVFLERYLDVAKKFLFDTYEVANTEESIKAIENNGDFRVEFFSEITPLPVYNPITVLPSVYVQGYDLNSVYYNTNTTIGGYVPINTTKDVSSLTLGLTSSNSSNLTTLNSNCNITNTAINSSLTTTSNVEPIKIKSLRKAKSRSVIETGRVEAGSSSSQQIKTVEKSFSYFPFYSVEYKMLPVSQKINTTDDIKIKKYCTNCGTKQKPEFKFCPTCGNKV